MANLTLSFARTAPSSARPGRFPYPNCLSGPAAGLTRLVFHQQRKSLCSQLRACASEMLLFREKK
jgi:hypothetical protein